MRLKISFLWLILLVAPAFLFAQQNIEFIKENFPNKKLELKEALKNIKDGNEYFNEGEIYYRLSLEYYLKAYKLNPNNAMLNYLIGVCYFKSTYKIRAIDYLEKAFQLDENVHTEIHYNLGRGYQLNSEWDKALNEYGKFKEILKKKYNKEQALNVIKRVEECTTAKELINKPANVSIKNIGKDVNSKFEEYGPVISADESVLMFTSKRENTTGGLVDELFGVYFEDVYIAYKQNEFWTPDTGGLWTPAKNMTFPINTEGHDAIKGISNDGQKLLLYKDDNGDGNLYISVLHGNAWTEPEKLDTPNINTSYLESYASFSYDEKTLYFVSNRPGGFGGRDIYYSQWDEEKNKWGEAINLGAIVNTKYNEEGVFMMSDGKTMYFSSEGHNTMGGYDIFKTIYNDSTESWSKPKNIGYPINTPDDDVFFAMSASGERGYYASFKPDGYGEKDLYVIHFIEETKSKITVLKGVIRDALTKEPLEASIELVDNTKNKLVSNFKSNSISGKYLVVLPSGINYGIAVNATGYLFHSENIDIPESEAAYQEIIKDIDLQKLEVGNRIILRNIFFDFDKFILRLESTLELQRLVNLMVDNPTLKVEIAGHTDNKGNDDYNQRLSENRAKSVVEYLIKAGINYERLTYKGYGEIEPMSTNETEEGRQLNRRVEFKIMSK